MRHALGLVVAWWSASRAGASGSSCVVNSTADLQGAAGSAARAPTPTPGTLRWCLATASTGTTVVFRMPAAPTGPAGGRGPAGVGGGGRFGTDLSSAVWLVLDAPLPAVLADSVVLDGFSQPWVDEPAGSGGGGDTGDDAAAATTAAPDPPRCRSAF